MQKKDVKIGEFYAYASSSWGRAQKVEVVDFDGKVRQGYGYNARTVNGITVKRTDGPRAGEEFVVTGRNLRHTWEQEEKTQKAIDGREATRRADAEEEAARRAGLARRIEDYLAGHGEPVREVYSGGPVSRTAIEAVGFEGTNTSLSRYAARFDLHELMTSGSVNERVVAMLLTDAESAVGA